jgi:thioredoxin 1
LSLCLIAAGCINYAGKGKQADGKSELEDKVGAAGENGEYPEVMHIMTADEFQAEVLDYDGIIFVDIGAHWCGPCRMLGPHINRLAVEMEGELKVVKLYEDDKGADNKAAYRKYVGKGIPTLVIFESGNVIAKEMGYMEYKDLKKWVEDNI